MERLTALGLLAVCLAAGGLSADGVVETFDASQVSGSIRAITDESVTVKTDDEARTVPRKDVSEILLGKSDDLMGQAGSTVVLTADEGRIAVEDITAEDGKISLKTELLGSLKAPISEIRAVLLSEANTSPERIMQRCRDMEATSSALDVMVVNQSGDKWISVEGVLLSITDEKVGFRFQGKDRTIDRDKVRALFIAKVKRDAPKIAGLLVGTDGSQVHFSTLQADADQVTATFGHLVEDRKIKIDQVAEIRMQSDRVANLSELKPVEVKEYGFFETKFPHKIDQAVSGKPLQLNGRTFRRGLGLHSHAELTWDIAGEYKQFVTIAGIDDRVRPNGDANLVILGDGKELATHRLTGKDDPQAVRVNVEGVEKLTIRVEFGQDKLGVSDHVDLAVARLLK
jgi:hypothetical protein